MTNCIINGCLEEAERHHALRDRHPFNAPKPGSTSPQRWRERPDLVQNLCRKHHFATLHQMFSRAGNWPAGWGFADTPLLRGNDAVESMLRKAATRGDANPSPKDKLGARRLAGGHANLVLYRMCAADPAHEDVGVVEAKLRLIGDHYRASLKRGIGGHHADKGDGFFVEMARTIRSSDLDERLAAVRLEGRVNLHTLPLIVATHSVFEDLVVSFTRNWQGPRASRRVHGRRSFCSKYLHFHAPEAFFIYDSVVLRRLGLRPTTSYEGFAGTALRYAMSGHSSDWSPRTVDMEIYGYEATGTD